jgi:hypothetical protein
MERKAIDSLFGIAVWVQPVHIPLEKLGQLLFTLYVNALEPTDTLLDNSDNAWPIYDV